MCFPTIADTSFTALFLRGYSLKRVVRKAGDGPQEMAADVEAQTPAEPDPNASVPASGVEPISRNDTAEEVTIRSLDEKEDEKKSNGGSDN